MAALISRDTPFYMSECLAALYGESRCKLVVWRASIYFASSLADLLKFKRLNLAQLQIRRFHKLQFTDTVNLSNSNLTKNYRSARLAAYPRRKRRSF